MVADIRWILIPPFELKMPSDTDLTPRNAIKDGQGAQAVSGNHLSDVIPASCNNPPEQWQPATPKISQEVRLLTIIGFPNS